MFLNFRQFEARSVLNFKESEAFHYHVNTETSDQNVSRSIPSLYDNGWHVGKITYYKNPTRI